MTVLWQAWLLRYGLVGVVSTCIHLTVAFVLLSLAEVGVFMANLAGFLCAFGFSYLVQAQYVFLANVCWQGSVRYFFVQTTALLLSITAFGFAHSNQFLLANSAGGTGDPAHYVFYP